MRSAQDQERLISQCCSSENSPLREERQCVCVFFLLCLISPCRSFEQCESVNNEEFAVYFKGFCCSNFEAFQGFSLTKLLELFLAGYKTTSDSCIII